MKAAFTEMVKEKEITLLTVYVREKMGWKKVMKFKLMEPMWRFQRMESQQHQSLKQLSDFIKLI